MIVVAEGAGSANDIAAKIKEAIDLDPRVTVLGHIQRGGSPNAYDRVLSTQFGVHAAELIRDGVFGVTVALKGNEITHNKLEDIAALRYAMENNPADAKAPYYLGCLWYDKRQYEEAIACWARSLLAQLNAKLATDALSEGKSSTFRAKLWLVQMLLLRTTSEVSMQGTLFSSSHVQYPFYCKCDFTQEALLSANASGDSTP